MIMRLIRAGIANVNSTVGAVESNLRKVVRHALEMEAAHCTVGVFPEQVLGGYPAEDLVQNQEFVSEQWRALCRFAEETSTCATAFVLGLAVRDGGFVYNAAALVQRGRIRGVVPKEHLPTYNVFYERRVFTAGVAGLYRELPVHYTRNETDADRLEAHQVDYKVPFGDLIFEFPFGKMAICVCEDSWTPDGPLARRAIADLQVIPNASPARQGVWNTRMQMLATRSADHECTLVAAYSVGGNDSLVFDGGGLVIQNGQIVGEAPCFREGVTTFDVDLSRTERVRNQNTTWRVRQEALQRQGETFRRITFGEPHGFNGSVSREFAQRFSFLPAAGEARDRALQYLADIAVEGLAGYYEKIGAFKKIVIALSGGKDSVLTLVLAYLYALRATAHLPQGEREAAIHDMIVCVSMPTRFNSEATKTISREICAVLGVTFVEESITQEFELELRQVRKISGQEPNSTTIGNIQARIRGARMWNLSNVHRALWLQTGNMSERAVGYTTIGGDLMGGYSLIGNLPKTVVMEMLIYLGKRHRIGTIDTLMHTRASAELAEGQFDEDELMPFAVLDLCFLLFAGEMYAPADVYRILRARWSDDDLARMHRAYQPGMLKDWVGRFFDLFPKSVFKWVQAPQTVHLGSLDLDRERALQIPVVTSSEWFKRSLEEMRALT
jgi:NAD+ synthase (glutamine-hydrolysing)